MQVICQISCTELKKYVLDLICSECKDENFNNSALSFIKSVIDNELIINNRKKQDIISDLEEMEFEKYNDSFDYLLNIPIYHLSKEKYEEYKEQAKKMKNELKEYKLLRPEEIWDKELDELEKALKKAGY